MNADRKADPQTEQIEDLASPAESVQDAEQVRGGFNPQPDPPGKIGVPIFLPPIYRPGEIVR